MNKEQKRLLDLVNKAIKDHKENIRLFEETKDEKYIKKAENALIRRDKYHKKLIELAINQSF